MVKNYFQYWLFVQPNFKQNNSKQKLLALKYNYFELIQTEGQETKRIRLKRKFVYKMKISPQLKIKFKEEISQQITIDSQPRLSDKIATTKLTCHTCIFLVTSYAVTALK